MTGYLPLIKLSSGKMTAHALYSWLCKFFGGCEWTDCTTILKLTFPLTGLQKLVPCGNSKRLLPAFLQGVCAKHKTHRVFVSSKMFAAHNTPSIQCKTGKAIYYDMIDWPCVLDVHYFALASANGDGNRAGTAGRWRLPRLQQLLSALTFQSLLSITS